MFRGRKRIPLLEVLEDAGLWEEYSLTQGLLDLLSLNGYTDRDRLEVQYRYGYSIVKGGKIYDKKKDHIVFEWSEGPYVDEWSIYKYENFVSPGTKIGIVDYKGLFHPT